MEAQLGIEPSYVESKSTTLPLGYKAKWNRDRRSTCIFPLAGNVLIRRPILSGDWGFDTPLFGSPRSIPYTISPKWSAMQESNLLDTVAPNHVAHLLPNCRMNYLMVLRAGFEPALRTNLVLRAYKTPFLPLEERSKNGRGGNAGVHAWTITIFVVFTNHSMWLMRPPHTSRSHNATAFSFKLPSKTGPQGRFIHDISPC